MLVATLMAYSDINTSSTYNNASSSASGSQSPASDTSSNISPVMLTNHALPGGDLEARSPTSGRITPSRSRVDAPRLTASKDGCWTCRLRRKKCDGNRAEDSGACETCRRLQIECLGWGSKRPEWMKDKKAQDEYKAKIKSTLLSNNMIRGQPRTNAHGSTSPSAPPRGAAPRPYPHPRRSPGGSSPPASGLTTPNPEYRSYSDPSFSNIDIASLFPTGPLAFDAHPAGISTTPDSATFDFSLTVPSVPYEPIPQEVPTAGPDPVQTQHVLYYFEHVRQMQFAFAGSNLVTNTMYSIILEEPQGAVTSAVCALAALHHSRMQVATFADHSPGQSMSQYFYNESWNRLQASKSALGHYTESDAIASLHLLSYSLLSRGTTDWRYVLDVSCEWLGQTGILTEDDPKFAISNMTQSMQFILKWTMWLDIVSSMTLMRPPRFLVLYRRLFSSASSGTDFWTGPSQEDTPELRMESLTGCPDDVMLALAEVSALAYWKTQEQQNGRLSVRELIRRGDVIELQLRSHTEPESFAEVDQALIHPSLVSDFAAMSASLEGATAAPSEETRRVVATIFRETVSLYLQTVLSDSIPGVPEITASVETIIKLFGRLPQSELDRSLIFPLCVTGCLTDNRARRDVIKRRLQGQDENLGNLMQARALMEAVWRRRDVSGGAVDWREILHNENLNLLLI
ncbi:hypothetical protein FIBSPDRAFT_775867 [Athelia psychrophila]|uniref:Zn(2)-C6 fungal-type domain-containing protein n=1 Tax=Athelia psychrophila TaxID=1759441 RepID=A0A166UL01_9AGAM|nr:hypothetical protein FIBSPDRAFT_775867 [Fibularhizoctonia sp. CBS 109695]